MRHRYLPLTALFALAAASVGLLVLSLTLGSVSLPLRDVLSALLTGEPALAQEVVTGLRLPRALAAFAVGGLLAVSGAILQVLLRNPLADPYVLGVSGGASVAALLAIMLGLPALGVDGFAAAGALAACLLVFGLAHGPGGWTATRLLLTGVVVAAGTGSVVALLLALGDETRLRGMVFWLLGDLSHARRWPWLLGLLAVAAVAGTLLGRHLNVLARGVVQAASVGLDARRVQMGLFLASSVLTGAAVSAAGSIGFVGLLTPHLVRLAVGSDHRIVLPASALAGGLLLMAADLAARVAIAPRQLPVGALTALVGVPVFLLLVRRHRS
ncbi:MAG: iron ABC transporter permease [Lysobacterales bacterium]|jgi:iron complex transport system permease protein|nr:MAG: iron ABC transporter permease [Xanthomonadales bacterium]